MDIRDSFEVQADFVLDVLKHDLRLIATTVGHPKFPRFVRKLRAQLTQFLNLIDTFEETIIEDFEKANEEELAHSAELLEVNCQIAEEDESEYKDVEDDEEDDQDWIRMEHQEHQDLIKELNGEEVEFHTTTKFRCKVLRIKVRLLINKLNQFEATVLGTSPLT